MNNSAQNLIAIAERNVERVEKKPLYSVYTKEVASNELINWIEIFKFHTRFGRHHARFYF